MNLNRVYAHYLQWEDYLAGQYAAPTNDPELAIKCSQLLSDPTRFQLAATRVINEWPISSAVNLSNISINRQAWLGQAACCLILGASEHLTKQGWHLLDLNTQLKANAVADAVISDWEARLCQNDHLELTF